VRAICDVCGGDVVQRDDDTEMAIRRRLELYEKETAPLIEWFEKQSLLTTVAGTGSPDEVTERLVAEVNRRKLR
jgi:adenylate kinase